MGAQPGHHVLTARDLEPILAVTAKLAAPFDLCTMLREVVERRQAGARRRARLGLALRRRDRRAGARDRDRHRPGARRRRARASSAAARATAASSTSRTATPTRASTPSVDRRSGYRTRCMLTLPLVDHNDVARGRDAGAEQGRRRLRRRRRGARHRARRAMRGRAAARAHDRGADRRREDAPAARDGARRADEHAAARTMPAVAGYDVYGTFKPADLTGGDTFDLALLDAGPARRAGRRHRPRHRAGAVGDADAGDAAHGVSAGRRPRDRVHAGQQPAGRDAAGRPLHHGLHRPARSRDAPAALPQRRPGADPALPGGDAANATRYKPTSFPLAAMPLTSLRPAVELELRRATSSRSLSDGIYEYRNAARRAVRRGARARRSLAAPPRRPVGRDLGARSSRRCRRSRGGAPQEDDMTVVLVKREAGSVSTDRLVRSAASTRIAELVAFTARGLRAASRSTSASCRPSTSRSRSCSRTWSNTAPEATRAGARRASATVAGGVEVTLTDYRCRPLRRHAGARGRHQRADRAAAARGPRAASHPQMVDSIEYEYREEQPAGPDHVPQDHRRTGRGEAKDGGRDAGNRFWRRTARWSIAGRLDAAQCPAAQAFLDKVQGTVTLDCSALEYISSAGLGVLLKTQKRLLAAGGKLRLDGREPPPARHLRVLGLRPDLRDRAAGR